MGLGIDEAEWHHSGGGKESRPTHVQAGREKFRYKISTGWYDPAVKRYIRPGEEPGCRCVGKRSLKASLEPPPDRHGGDPIGKYSGGFPDLIP